MAIKKNQAPPQGKALSRGCLLAAACCLTAACSRTPSPSKQQPEQAPQVITADGEGEATKPRVGPNAGVPVETAPPNAPEFKPAFAGQTRAPSLHSETKFRVSEVATGLDQPWALEFLPDGRMLVTEKHDGELFVVTAEGKKSEKALGVPRVDGRGQGGLLDVALSPEFAKNQRLFLSYYEPRKGGNGLTVASARFSDGPQPKLDQLKVVFRMQPTLDSTMHAGGRLVFAPDGNLFIAMGERSIKEGRVQARDLGSHLGKVVRIRPDGSIPQDNPFVAKAGARKEIWTSGHRNPLAAALDAQNRLWVVEMGPRGGDELNLVERGKDYGWPTIGYGEEYSGERIHESTQAPGLEQPIYYWDPVISPGALSIYSGQLFPEWKGNFFIAGLSSKALIRLKVEGDRVVGEERLLMDQNARIREVVQGPEGALYLLTDGSGGKILKLSPG